MMATCTMTRFVYVLLSCGLGARADPRSDALPHQARLPVTRVEPTVHKLKSAGASTLYELRLPANNSYASGPPLVISLKGTRREIGRAYAELLGEETLDTFDVFLRHVFPNATTRALFEAFTDWIWDRFAAARVPREFLDELEGMRDATPAGRRPSVDQVSRRFNVLANLPADPQNLISALEQELEKQLTPAVAALLNAIIDALDGCSWCDSVPSADGRTRRRLPSSPRCDAFATWGSRTEGGLLFSSRNLDWQRNTGVNRRKLISIFTIPGTAGPYATFGYATGFGALAGMSAAGLSVAEMNLDSSQTTFDGPPFPTRLRMVLERAASLEEARELWEATNNTDSMNFMIASAADRAALAIEAIGGAFAPEPPHAAFSAFFRADDPREANATCAVGPSGAAGTCGDGFPDTPSVAGRKSIGAPLGEAVWRTNHAVHPTVQAHQEPLFNDTSYRYQLLRRLFDEAEQAAARGARRIDDEAALGIAATLGIKGPNFFSCDPAQFADPSATHVMSVVYAPRIEADGAREKARAWVAWEDSTPDGAGWRPAACNPYIAVDLAGQWW